VPGAFCFGSEPGKGQTVSNGKTLAAIVPCLLAVGAAQGADTPTTRTDALAQSALASVPADCVGFVYVRNVKEAASRLDAFINEVRPTEPAILQDRPGGAEARKPFSILAKVTEQAGLGKGFDAGGDLAIVLVAPPRPAGAAGATTKQAEAAAPGEPEVVYVLPVTDPQRLLAGTKPSKDGALLRIERPDGATFYALALGARAAVSRDKLPLAAMASKKRAVAADLPPSARRLLAESDVFAWAPWGQLRPVMQRWEARVARRGRGREVDVKYDVGPDGSMTMTSATTRREVFIPTGLLLPFGVELEHVAVGARFARTGVRIEARLGFDGVSAMGKALVAYKPVSAPLLHRLPAMPYAIAVGVDGRLKTPADDATKAARDALRRYLPEAPAELVDSAIQAAREWEDQILGIQVYVGEATAGRGRLGAAAVVEAKSADKVLGLIRRGVPILNKLHKCAPDDQMRPFSLRVEPSTISLGSRKVKADEIHVDHPALTAMSEEDRLVLRAFFGEDKLRIVVLKATEKRLLLTMGGGSGFLAAALEASAGSGRLQQDPHVVKALKQLPDRPMGVALLNVANAWRVVSAALDDARTARPDLKLDTHVPLACALVADKTDLCAVVHVPAEPSKQAAQAVMDAVGWIIERMLSGLGDVDVPGEGDIVLPPPLPEDDF
jgi:hypothetical protein